MAQKQKSLFMTLATVASLTKPGKTYQIKMSLRTGTVSCNCPAWIFQKGGERKPCKHIARWQSSQVAEAR